MPRQCYDFSRFYSVTLVTSLMIGTIVFLAGYVLLNFVFVAMRISAIIMCTVCVSELAYISFGVPRTGNCTPDNV